MRFLRSVRLWFSLAVAVIAATVADPLLEAASNAGVFGSGTFTDHSNLDVLPALGFGIIAVVIHVLLRIRGRNGNDAMIKECLRRWDVSLRWRAATLLPLTFVAQMLALYSMETIEQIVVAGHPLGGLIWLGAPAAIAVTVHALMCVAAFFVATCVMHEVAWATLRVVTVICAILTRDDIRAFVVPRLRILLRKEQAPELWTAGGRAPPSYAP